MSEISKKAEVSVELKGTSVNGVQHFELGPLAQLLKNDCAGKKDGESCGTGCTCKAGQPVMTFEGLRNLGLNVRVIDPK